MPRKREGLLRGHPRCAERCDLYIVYGAWPEHQKDQAVVGGDIHQTVLGELLQHALARAVVGGLDGGRKRAAGVLRGLHRAAVHGDHLAELEQVASRPLTERSETVFRYDFADTKPGIGAGGRGLIAGPKAGWRHQGALFENFLGQNLGRILLQNLCFLGNNREHRTEWGLREGRRNEQNEPKNGQRGSHTPHSTAPGQVFVVKLSCLFAYGSGDLFGFRIGTPDFFGTQLAYPSWSCYSN